MSGGVGSTGLGALNLQGKDFSKAKLGSTAHSGSGNSISPRGGSSTSPAHGTRSLSGSSSHSGSSSLGGGGAAVSGINRIRPLRFGVRFSPPTLALEYRDLKYPTRRRSKLKCFDLASLFGAEMQQGGAAAVESISRQLARKFEAYLGENIVTQTQLARMVRKALSKQTQQQQTGGAVAQSRTTPAAPGTRSQHQSQPLHHAPADDSLDLSTSVADEVADHDSTGDLDGLYHPAPRAADDLNAVSTAVLAAKKAEMNKIFEANLLKPTDAGYVYDKQVEFNPTEESEWD